MKSHLGGMGSWWYGAENRPKNSSQIKFAIFRNVCPAMGPSFGSGPPPGVICLLLAERLRNVHLGGMLSGAYGAENRPKNSSQI